MKKINVNSEVTVELTELGEKILRDEFDKLTNTCRGLKGINFETDYRIKDRKAKMTLWKVMNQFGPYMHPGAVKYPINNMTIYIEDSDIKEV